MQRFTVHIIGAGNKGAFADAPACAYTQTPYIDNRHKYLSYGHAAHDHPGFEIAEFYDMDRYRAAKAAEIWGATRTDMHDVDVWVIATPDNTHYDYIIAALDKPPYPRLIICEKPLCMDADQGYQILQRVQETGCPVLLDYTRRFIPHWRQLRGEVELGWAGEFLRGYCYFNRGWEHTASHFVDLALWFNGSMDRIQVTEIPTEYQWVFQWGLFYKKEFYSEHAVNFTRQPQVNSMYDRHLYHVLDNAYEHLTKGAPLLCTAEDGLRAIEATQKLMERQIL